MRQQAGFGGNGLRRSAGLNRAVPQSRGMALIFVLLLLTMLLFLALSFLTRGNHNLFTVSRDEQTQQAWSAAQAGAAWFAADLVQNCKVSPLTQALTQATSDLTVGNASLTPIKANDGTIVGYAGVPVFGGSSSTMYADISYSVDNPHIPDTSCSFGAGNYALPYVTVRVHSVGSALPSSYSNRVTRTVDANYNIYCLTAADMQGCMNFVDFMTSFEWWAGFSPGQANLIGNAGANGNYTVISGNVTSNGGTTLNYGGKSFTDYLYAELQVLTGANGVSGISGNLNGPTSSQVANYFPRLQAPDLSTIANDNGLFVKTATGQIPHQDAQGNTTSQPGSITVQKVSITLDANGNLPRDPTTGALQYTPVGSAQTVVKNGVYPDASLGQNKENVLLGSQLPTTPGSPNATVTTDVVNINGPVVVKGNAVLQGLVQGRGSLFVGRNLYQGGDIAYVNPPSTAPNTGSNGFYGTVQQPASADYQKDQLILAASQNVVQGDVSSQWWWSATVQPWLNWVDPTTGKSVSNGVSYDYNRDFNFASRQNSSGTYTPQSFNSTWFDVYSPSNGNNMPSSYSSFAKSPGHTDGYVMAGGVTAGWQGHSGDNYTGFGGWFSRLEAVGVNLNSGYKYYLYQDTRFLNSPDVGLPSGVLNSCIVVSAGGTLP